MTTASVPTEQGRRRFEDKVVFITDEGAPLYHGEPGDTGYAVIKSFKKLDSASVKLGASDVAKMDREFMYFGHNAMSA